MSQPTAINTTQSWAIARYFDNSIPLESKEKAVQHCDQFYRDYQVLTKDRLYGNGQLRYQSLFNFIKLAREKTKPHLFERGKGNRVMVLVFAEKEPSFLPEDSKDQKQLGELVAKRIRKNQWEFFAFSSKREQLSALEACGFTSQLL